MINNNLKITNEDILALDKIIDLIEIFINKNPIKKYKANFKGIKENINKLKGIEENNKNTKNKLFNKILRKLKAIIKRENYPQIFFIIGGHGGVIINDISFCEFDSPEYALDSLLKKMQLAIKTNMPYNLEVAVCCLEWLNENFSDKMSEFLRLFKLGRFEIINPTYSQPYSLIIGAESNIKQFEHGIKVLKKLGLESNLFYASESSLHPQIPQILKGFNIKFGSLRTRLLGVSPTSNSACINWVGLDNSSIDAIIDQSGVFNGEYWHGTFFREIPNLLFQAITRPFVNYILYSSIEDFIMPQPYQEEVWRISRFSDIFGKFLSCSEVFRAIDKEGEYKYSRDDFLIGSYIFFSSKLCLYNKNSEITLISAEILNCVLGIFDKKSNDSFLDESWKKLLLTQAHDCYAVPFTRTADYSRTQLSREEFNKLQIKEGNITISKLSIQILEEIQNKCNDFINSSLICLSKELGRKKKNTNEIFKNILIFNPTPYLRSDIVSIQCELENSSKMDLKGDNEEINFQYKNSTLKFIAEIPGFGYKVYNLTENNIKKQKFDTSFFYEITISKDLDSIQIKYKNENIYELKFLSNLTHELILKKKNANDVEERNEIMGKLNDQTFKLEIIQYNGVNRLEFILDSNSLKKIVLKPNIRITNSFVNYPFGMEETKRSKIQTLDFLWLKGAKRGIIYVQKNSQQFVINRENFVISNLVYKKGIYEFAISITNENDFHSALIHVNSYYFKLLGIYMDNAQEFNKKTGSFLSLKPLISVINLWRRENGSFIRLFNPSNEEFYLEFKGKLIKNQLREIDFNHNELLLLQSNRSKIAPWKIKTFKFNSE